jgi:hypothetical protein
VAQPTDDDLAPQGPAMVCPDSAWSFCVRERGRSSRGEGDEEWAVRRNIDKSHRGWSFATRSRVFGGQAMKRVVWIFAVLLTACAAQPSVTPAGEGTYIASRSGQAYNSITGLKAKALSQADDFCAAKHMTFKVLNSTNSDPPYIFGNYPRVEIQFKCVPMEAETK